MKKLLVVVSLVIVFGLVMGCPNDTPKPEAEYTVTVENGTAQLTKATEGTMITIVANDAPTGYLFKEWISENAGTSFVDAKATTTSFFMPKRNITVIATYEQVVTYDITFNANGGIGDNYTQTFTEGVPQSLRTNTFTKDGYTFEGWNTQVDGNGTDYTENETFIAASNITLFAKWASKNITTSYDITFNANGGIGDDYTQTFTEGVSQSLRTNTFTKDGYTFEGWNTQVDGNGTDYTENETFTATSNITLFAKWTSDIQVPVKPFTVNQDGVLIKYTGTDREVIIPSTIDGILITAIGGSAFYDSTSLISITIPDSVTSIGYGAFNDCSSLQSIIMPDSVTSIESSAFSGCSSLTSIAIPDTVISIGSFAFDGCSSLTSITIPDSVTTIGYRAFSGCSNLTEVTTPVWDSFQLTSMFEQEFVKTIVITNGTSIKYRAFEDFSSLEDIAIPNGVISIGHSAFKGCSSLTSITIPDSVTSIGEYAFNGCSSLREIITPVWDSFKLYDMFRNDTEIGSLKTIVITSGVSIGEDAFVGCSGLTNISIPGSITSIGNYAFIGCSSLTSITIPDSVISIGKGAFSYCLKLESINIPNSVTTIGDYAFQECSGLASLTIGNSVTSIGVEAFGKCSSLTNITLPDSITSVGRGAFLDCSILTEMTIPIWDDFYRFSYMFNQYDQTTVKTITITITSGASIPESAFFRCSALESITIPDSVTSIGQSAFKDCHSLTSISIPNSITSIEESTFEDCHSLTSISIPDSVTTIGSEAFYNCSNLTIITIPDNVSSIGKDAFRGCSSLEKITTPIWDGFELINMVSNYASESLKIVEITKGTAIGQAAFKDCSTLTNVTIPNSVISIGDYAFYDCTSLESITIPDSVTSIGSHVFTGCSSLSKITTHVWEGFELSKMFSYFAPESLKTIEITNGTSIGSRAFSDSRGLESITIPKSITSIGDSAFLDCGSLLDITIPESITTIGNNAFQNCSSLTSITIPDTVTAIGVSVFSGCNSLAKITTPVWEGIKLNEIDALETIVISSGETIGHSAFKDCTALTNVIIPDSVTSISDYAFSGCSNLTSITIPDTVTVIGVSVFRGCSSLTKITTPVWQGFSLGDILGDDNELELLKTIEIAHSSATIGNNAFAYCNNLTSIIIPDSVVSIGGAAFYACSSLTSITIPDSVTSIGQRAFEFCNSLTSITIKASIPPDYYYIPSDIVIYVPNVNAYRTDPSWAHYNLKEI